MISVAAVPGPPATPGVSNVVSTRCTLAYQLPSDEGDAPITGYHLQRRHVTSMGDGIGWETVTGEPVAALEFVVDHLKPQSKYEFRVAAENQFGIGEFGKVSRCITTDNSVRILYTATHTHTRTHTHARTHARTHTHV